LEAVKNVGADYSGHSQNGYVTNGVMASGTITLENGDESKNWKTRDSTVYAAETMTADAWHWGEKSAASGSISFARNATLIQT